MKEKILALKLTYDYDPEEAYLKTLGWVNNIRSKNGEPTLGELAVGYPESSYSCSLARSFNQKCMVYNKTIQFYNRESTASNYKQVRLPGYARKFIEYFDEGYYPDLVHAK